MELISRDKVLMNARPEYLNPNQEKLASYNQGWNNAIEMYCKQIAELPIIEEQKEGSWIPVDSYSAFGGCEWIWEAHGNPIAYHYCSECKEQTYADEFGEEILSNFCPHCGAKMERKIDENDLTKDDVINMLKGIFEEQRKLTDEEMQAYKDMLRKKERKIDENC